VDVEGNVVKRTEPRKILRDSPDRKQRLRLREPISVRHRTIIATV
jgi:hypothetical protein